MIRCYFFAHKCIYFLKDNNDIIIAYGICIMLRQETLDSGSIPGAAMLDGSFILATSAVRLITVVPACLLGLT